MEAFTFSDKNTISGEMWDLTLVDKIKKIQNIDIFNVTFPSFVERWLWKSKLSSTWTHD